VFSHRTFSYGRRSERLAFREEIMRIARPRGANTVIRIRPLGSAPRQMNLDSSIASGSAIVRACGSSSASAASENATRCFLRFAAALA
jgi:hypothetical protein